MSENTRTNRERALDLAVVHAPNFEDSAEERVKAAELYLAFLDGDQIAEVKPPEPVTYLYVRKGSHNLTYRYPFGAQDSDQPEVFFRGEGWTESNTYDTVREIRQDPEFSLTSDPERN